MIDSPLDEFFEKYTVKDNTDYLKEVFNQFSLINKTILCAKYTFPINEENLKILTNVNMNIFTEIINYRELLVILNKTIEAINEHLHLAELDLKYTKPESGYYKKLQELRKIFHTNIDDCIYTAELLIKCLNKSGKILTRKSKDGKEIFKQLVIPQIDDSLLPKLAIKHDGIEEWLEKV